MDQDIDNLLESLAENLEKDRRQPIDRPDCKKESEQHKALPDLYGSALCWQIAKLACSTSQKKLADNIES